MSTKPTWKWDSPLSGSLWLGRVQLAQVNNTGATEHWSYFLFFTEREERSTWTVDTRELAMAAAEEHAAKVLNQPAEKPSGWKIICTDNFDREHVPDSLVAGNITSVQHGRTMLDALRTEAHKDKSGTDWFLLVPADYKLKTMEV